jgi:outer membrane immunogenic protein
MTSLRTAVAGFALLAAGVTGVGAEGIEDRARISDGQQAAPFSWAGLYVGATAGGGWGDSRQSDESVKSNPFDLDGFVGGATVGYNLQFHRNWVMGIEADISASNISGDFKGELGTPDPGQHFGCPKPCATDVNWFGTVRGRIGYTSNTLLLYGTGGLAYGGVKSGIGNFPDNQVSDTNVGWTVGGGFEYAFAPNWSAKAEYLHVDLGWTHKEGPDPFRADAEFDVVRAGLNYRFK